MHGAEQSEEFSRKFSELRTLGVKFFEVVFQDLWGTIRGRILKPEKAEDVLRGFRVDAYSLGFSRIEESDALLVPDTSTLRIYRTSLGPTGFLVGDLYFEGKPLPNYPRAVLKDASSTLGFDVLIGAEIEFYLARDYKPLDTGAYMHLSPYTSNSSFLAEVMGRAEGAGVAITAAHHEVGPGQYEVLPRAMPPVELGDTVVFLKKLVWEAASERNIQATFMPKPFKNLPGNGLHLHISLYKNGGNILVEDGEITEAGLSVVGGLLYHAVPLILLTNPTVNSYKRLTPGFEAPIYVSWGRGNRSTMVRLPMGLKGLAGPVEYRLPDASGNIYLKILSAIYSARKGLELGLEPPPECRDNAYKRSDLKSIPQTLGEAIEAAARNIESAPDLKTLLVKLIELKTREWNSYVSSAGNPDPREITDWEIREYFYS